MFINVFIYVFVLLFMSDRMVFYWLCFMLSLLSACKYQTATIMTEKSLKDLTVIDSTYYLAQNLYTGYVTNAASELRLIAKERFQVIEGKLNGYCLQWTKDGVLRTENHYVAGRKEGPQKGYHLNGQLSYSYNVSQNHRQGKYYEYFPDGILQIEKTYEKGQVIAEKIFDIDGYTLANFKIKDGRIYGFRGSSNCINVISEKYINN